MYHDPNCESEGSGSPHPYPTLHAHLWDGNPPIHPFFGKMTCIRHDLRQDTFAHIPHGPCRAGRRSTGRSTGRIAGRIAISVVHHLPWNSLGDRIHCSRHTSPDDRIRHICRTGRHFADHGRIAISHQCSDLLVHSHPLALHTDSFHRTLSDGRKAQHHGNPGPSLVLHHLEPPPGSHTYIMGLDRNHGPALSVWGLRYSAWIRGLGLKTDACT
mmetsp:Transcript_48419/g.75603  ORF Transcript_48419/g.75603 Transcript_48419/m.75603 type:complete len:214 (-) Transcript_48419:46-687(-)